MRTQGGRGPCGGEAFRTGLLTCRSERVSSRAEATFCVPIPSIVEPQRHLSANSSRLNRRVVSERTRSRFQRWVGQARSSAGRDKQGQCKLTNPTVPKMSLAELFAQDE
jgi:hypothetical protein